MRGFYMFLSAIRHPIRIKWTAVTRAACTIDNSPPQTLDLGNFDQNVGKEGRCAPIACTVKYCEKMLAFGGLWWPIGQSQLQARLNRLKTTIPFPNLQDIVKQALKAGEPVKIITSINTLCAESMMGTYENL